MITHEPDIAGYAKRIISILDGKIVQDRKNGHLRRIGYGRKLKEAKGTVPVI